MTVTTTIPRSLNCTQDYFSKTQHRPHIRDIPSLNPALLKRARNCIRRSPENNDLLEFIGDRAVNLLIAILVDKVKLSKAHHTTVRRIVCNNDTFGRLSFYLRIHLHAELESQDKREVEDWDPLSAEHPPKVLADLFEAYAGAVYIQYGWSKLETWLQKVFDPIIKVSTGDYWMSSSAQQIFGPSPWCPNDKVTVPETKTQGKLLDYVEFKRENLKTHGQQALDALSSSTKFRFDSGGRLQVPDIERVEVAVHLINMWICNIVIQLWPEYHNAIAKAAHMLSAITGLIISERVMAYLASLLDLDKFFEVVEVVDSKNEPTENSDGSLGASKASSRLQPHPSSRPITPTPNQRAIMLKATIGWFYYEDSGMSKTWGETWLKPIVMRAHDILVDLQGFRPLIHRGARTSSSALLKDPIVSLVSGMASVTIRDTQKGTSPSPTISAEPDASHLKSSEKDEDNSLGLVPPSKRIEPSASNSSTGKMRIVVRIKNNAGIAGKSPLNSPEAIADNRVPALASLSLSSSPVANKWKPIGQASVSQESAIESLSDALSTLFVSQSASLVAAGETVIADSAVPGQVAKSSKWQPIGAPSVEKHHAIPDSEVAETKGHSTELPSLETSQVLRPSPNEATTSSSRNMNSRTAVADGRPRGKSARWHPIGHGSSGKENVPVFESAEAVSKPLTSMPSQSSFTKPIEASEFLSTEPDTFLTVPFGTLYLKPINSSSLHPILSDKASVSTKESLHLPRSLTTSQNSSRPMSTTSGSSESSHTMFLPRSVRMKSRTPSYNSISSLFPSV